MRTKKELLLIYFNGNPLELMILQDKAYGSTETKLAGKYKAQGYTIHKIKRLRIKLIRLFGRRNWKEVIFEAQELELIKKVPQLKIGLYEKPNAFLISTIEMMEDRHADRSHELKEKEWRKKKKKLGWR